MILSLLRFLRGWVRFSVSGKYPERFINIALRNRIRIWNTRRGESLSACMYMRDYLRVRQYARGSGVRLKVCERRGLPVLLRRYSGRIGLIIGAAAFVITVFVMSLFIWSIDVTGLETISESEMRSMLADNGVYVGAFKPFIDYQSVSRSIMLADSRVGWMAINAEGSYASVELKEESPPPKVEDTSAPCNVKAKRDGRLLRVDAEEGKTVLKEGSGVVAGQVIVSGVMEDQLGGVRLVHAKARAIAETDRHASFEIPEKIVVTAPTGESKRRLTADLFGLKIPLTVGGVSTAEVLTDEMEETPAPLDVRLPAGLITRTIYGLERKEQSLKDNSAKELLLTEARLYEVFSMCECTVTKRSCRFSKTSEGYSLEVGFTCTEDIACQESIGVGEEGSRVEKNQEK